MDNFVKSFKIYFKIYLKDIFCFIVLVLILVGGYFISLSSRVDAKDIKKEKEEKVIEKIKVDVKGAVKNPGVYELELGSRVIDAINIAGGLNENSNTSIINLSKKLQDEYVVVVYTNNDLNSVVMDKYVKNNNNCPATINNACIINNDIQGNKKQTNQIVTPNTSNSNNNKNETTKENKNNISNNIININTASLDELMTISGIGESKAQAIIKYREENGGFKSIDELTNVSGIGTSTFEKIKDSITI